MDEQIIKRFKSFQKEINKYSDLDFSLIKFDLVELGNGVCDFPAITRVTGGFDLKHSDYQNLSEDERIKYVPLISGTVENNQISGYIDKTKISANNISKSKSISWTRINPKYFFLQEDPVCINDDSFIMQPNEFNYYKYIRLAIVDTMSKIDGLGWSNKAGKNAIKEKKIQIPLKINETYTSKKIQEILVEFIEFYSNRNDSNLQIVSNVSDVLDKIEKVVLPLFFQNHESVAKKFDRFCKKNKINLKLSDIEFEDKLIDDLANLKGGGSNYSKPYFSNPDNNGIYDVLTGSLSPVPNIKPIKEMDIITQESVSFNKDNDAGSRAFYHNKPYIIGGHHYGVIVKPEHMENVNVKYFYYTMKHLFDNNMFYQSKEPRANSGVIKMFRVKFPKATKELSSFEIQTIVVDFIENYLLKINTMKSATEKLKTIIAAHSKTIIYKTFNS